MRPVPRALGSGRLEAFGAPGVITRIEPWLNLGPLTRIQSQLPPGKR